MRNGPQSWLLPVLDVEIDVAHRERHFDARAVAAAEAVLQRDPVEPFAGAEHRTRTRRIALRVPLAQQEILRLAHGEKTLLGVAKRERHHRRPGLGIGVGVRIAQQRLEIGNLGGRIVRRLDRADEVVRVDGHRRKVCVPALQHRAVKDRLDIVGKGRLVARLERAARIESGNEREVAHPDVVDVVPGRDDVARLRRIAGIAGDVPAGLHRRG